MNVPIKNRVLSIGDRAPDFTLTDAATDRSVSLDDLVTKPVVISFGRGTW
jgi:peroxiredoxin